MQENDWLTTADIKAIFAEEILSAGGTVSETFDDGTRLFARSILPWVREIRQKDKLQGGVALRATVREVWVHPYVFREVCSNGAIMAHAIQTQHIEDLDCLTPEEATPLVRAAVQACCVEEAFTAATEEISAAGTIEADLALNMLPLLSRLRSHFATEILSDIMNRFFRDADRSRFGLMNAVTSVARDTRDPEVRWRLEELGGGIPAGRPPTTLPDDAAGEMSIVGSCASGVA
jgi:hypothetical protein